MRRAYILCIFASVATTATPVTDMKRKSRLLLIVPLALCLMLLGAGFYMLDLALKPTNKGRNIAGSYRQMFERYPYLQPWVDSLNRASALLDTFVTGDDGARLHALCIAAPTPTHRTAVLVHGYTDNAVRMLMIAELYNRRLGYNVLLPDLRNSGLSDGRHYGMGWLDRFDVLRWLQVAHQRYGTDAEVTLHGISMGAATVMMLSGEALPHYVKSLVADCGYTSVWDEFAYRLKTDYGLPPFPLLHITSALCKLRYGWSFGEASALTQVARCRLPILFIHSTADAYVPTAMSYRLYRAKPGDKELWLPAESAHAMSFRDHTDEYERRVREFVNRYTVARHD